MTWKKQDYRLDTQPIPSEKKFIEFIKSIKDQKEQFLILIVYLLAGRITEIIGRKKLIKYDYTCNIYREYPAIKPLTKERFSIIDKKTIEKDGKIKKRKVLLVNIYNEKSKVKTKRFKDIPIPLDTYGVLVSLILKYVETKDEREPLIPYSYMKVWRILDKYNLNPHLLRHYRLTHLVVHHGYGEYKLQQYAGWTDTRPAKHYVSMNWSNLLEGL